jgi:hypothetical protein
MPHVSLYCEEGTDASCAGTVFGLVFRTVSTHELPDTRAPPAPRSCSFAPSVTTPLYRTTVSRTLRGKWILYSYPKMARGKYEETIQFGWSTISEIFRSSTRLAST